MAEHKFGGDWTELKLSRLRKYLNAYRQIFTRNTRARHLKTWYVDAFAGTGSRTRAPAQKAVLLDDVYQDEETTQYQDGSAKIALSLAAPFDQYFFIDKSKAHMTTLQQTIKREHSMLLPRCEFRQGDANSELKAWCKERNWNKERAVVFLDPYGMQVEWSTVEALAATRAIDLWYLFPLGVGVARLLTHSGAIEESWKRRLSLLFGTDKWQTEFYKVDTAAQSDLFGGMQDIITRDASIAKIRNFIQRRLAETFEKAAEGLVLRNSLSSPLYLLCFASANPKGAATAIKIAQNILKED